MSDELMERLDVEMNEVDDFINGPPLASSHSQSSAVTEYRHELYPKWSKVVSSIKDLRDRLQSQWVSCEDRLPDYAEDDNCLITLQSCISGTRIVRSGHCRKRSDSLWWSDNYEVSSVWDVIKWMPLPPPPEDKA